MNLQNHYLDKIYSKMIYNKKNYFKVILQKNHNHFLITMGINLNPRKCLNKRKNNNLGNKSKKVQVFFQA